MLVGTSSHTDIPSMDDLRLVELAVPTEPITVQVQIDGGKTPEASCVEHHGQNLIQYMYTIYI